MSANTYAALLRGINVGGKHKLPMKDLVEVFADRQMCDVRTYIQSGNVVFTCFGCRLQGPFVHRWRRGSRHVSVSLCRWLCAVIEQLAQVVRNNPFLKAGKPQTTLHVMLSCRRARSRGNRQTRSRALARRRVSRRRQRDLSLPAQWSRQIQADECLLRFQAVDRSAPPELGNRAQAVGDDDRREACPAKSYRDQVMPRPSTTMKSSATTAPVAIQGTLR